MALLAVGAPLASAQSAVAGRETALAAFRRGDLDGAERACRAWLREHPRDVEVTQLLGMTRFRRALHLDARVPTADARAVQEQALDTLLRAEKLAAGRPLPDLNQALGYLLWNLGRPQEALGRLNRAVEEAPGRPLPYRLRGQVHMDLDSFAQAEGDLRQAAALAPRDFETRMLRAQALSRQGRAEETRRTLKEALGLLEDPRDERRARVLYEIHRQSLALNEFARARDELQQALELQPGQGQMTLELAELAYRLGDLPAAERHAQSVGEALSAPPHVRARALHQRGLIAQHRGRSAEARDLYEGALSADPQRAETLKNYAAVLRALGDAPGARQALKRFAEVVEIENRIRRLRDQLAIEPGDTRSRVELIRRLLRLGRGTQAAEELEHLRLRHPGHTALPDLERRLRRVQR